VPDAVVVLCREPQLGGQALAVGEQALHRRRVGGRVAAAHLGDPVVDELDEAGPALVFSSSVSKIAQQSSLISACIPAGTCQDVPGPVK
jgi:hypothetical protein